MSHHRARRVEAISYQIPTFKLDGKPLIYVAAWKNHIAVYPIPDGDEELATRHRPAIDRARAR